MVHGLQLTASQKGCVRLKAGSYSHGNAGLGMIGLTSRLRSLCPTDKQNVKNQHFPDSTWRDAVTSVTPLLLFCLSSVSMGSRFSSLRSSPAPSHPSHAVILPRSDGLRPPREVTHNLSVSKRSGSLYKRSAKILILLGCVTRL